MIDGFELLNKGLKFCKRHIAEFEDELQQGITAGELIRERSREVGGVLGDDAYVFGWRVQGYLERALDGTPLNAAERWLAAEEFYNLGYTWHALNYNAYNREYARIYAKIGKRHLASLAEGSRRIKEQCWGYPALRGRLTHLVTMAEFAESTYFSFFLGILAYIQGT